jgi:hypothetical protein
MRIAHLILAHEAPEHVERLIKRLQHPKADFFIHIDLKANINPFLYLENLGQVHFIRPRVSIFKDGFSSAEAILNGFDYVLQTHKRYDYFNILSGRDYPLKDVYEIHQFFKQNPGKIFMESRMVDSEWKEGSDNIKKYYFGYNPFFGSKLLAGLASTFLPARKIPKNLKAYGGSEWFTISSLHANIISDYLLDFPSVTNFFKNTRRGNEFIFQTLMKNSDYTTDFVDDNMRFIASVPDKILTIEDAEKLMKSGKLFARKFDAKVDSKILDYLDDQAAIAAQNRPVEEEED